MAASTGSSLMNSYYLYSAILALKLLALTPLANIVCNQDMIKRANLSDLKNLTPFWLVAGLYMTTSPDKTIAINLLRAFVVARIVAVVGYIEKVPRLLNEASFFVSFAITSFMAGCVVMTYKDSI